MAIDYNSLESVVERLPHLSAQMPHALERPWVFHDDAGVITEVHAVYSDDAGSVETAAGIIVVSPDVYQAVGYPEDPTTRVRGLVGVGLVYNRIVPTREAWSSYGVHRDVLRGGEAIAGDVSRLRAEAISAVFSHLDIQPARPRNKGWRFGPGQRQ